MAKIVFCVLLSALSLWIIPADGQSVPVLKFDQLKQRIDQPNDTLYIVNFWATWCAPCVKEMPQFEAVRQAYANKKVRVLLVSMDDKDVLNTKVKPFVRNRKIRSEVILLDEPDANMWIDKLAPEWAGSLPMTLIVNRKQNIRQLIDKPVKEGELELVINQYKL